MPHARRRARAATAALVLPVLLAAGPAAATPTGASEETAAVPDPPSHGSVLLHQKQRSTEPLAAATVHGVRRVDGGTVVYFSVGYLPAPGAEDSFPLNLRGQATAGDRFGVTSDWAGMAAVVDPASRQVHTVLVTEDGGDCLCSGFDALDATPGATSVLWSAFPELPETTSTVDVLLGRGAVVHDVPVEDGLMEPVSAGGAVVPLGAGWPEVDEAAVLAASEPAAGTYPMTTSVADERQEVTQRDSADASSVDIAADVLFAVDSADLSPQAREVLERAAEQVAAAARPGAALRVVGHTDSDGGSAYNQDLSERRAAAVAAVLEPLLEVDDLTLAVEGRGEEEPVADEGTEQGKQANRRVSVVLAGGDEGAS